MLDLLDQYGIEYVETGKNIGKGWIGCVCPFHDDPSTHLGYCLEGKFFSCWTCGHISVYDVLHEWGIPYEAYKAVAGTDYYAKRKRIVHGKLKYPSGWMPELLTIHRKYLNKRGFDPDQLLKIWKLGSIGLASRMAWSLFIPVFYQGQVVSWTTRSIKDTGIRYINAKPEEESLPSKKLLFGHDHVRHAVVITEGPFDAMRIGPGAVATLGMMVSQAQTVKLSKFPIRTIMFDPEPNAQRRARVLADLLSVFPGTTKVVQIDAADPGCLKPKEVQQIRKEFLDG